MAERALSTNNVVEMPIRPGRVFGGKFRVERVIGEGAMGLVVEATHLALDERVALKFLHREARERPDIVARFAREARAAAKISSDHVARVYDVGPVEDTSPFIVMEYLDGDDLERILEKNGPMPIVDAVEVMIQACEGVTAAHVQGIVHRDIKPANIFITERGGLRQAKLLDFGISKAGITKTGTLDDIDIGSADTTQIMGSPHYMSPEQMRSTRDVDGRADIWSLGVVLFELLTGQTPFTATEVTGIIAQVLHDAHRPVRSLRADAPAELEAVVHRCLEKDPKRRFQTAAALATALLPFAPKRARAVVERANAVDSRASGRIQADSVPPPPPSNMVPVSSMRHREPSGATSSIMTRAVSSAAASGREERSPIVWFALLAVMLGLGGGTFAAITHFRGAAQDTTSKPESKDAPPRDIPPASSPGAATFVGARAQAAEPPPEPSAGAQAAEPTSSGTHPAAAASPATARPHRVRPPGSARAQSPAASPPAAPTVDSEIRHER